MFVETPHPGVRNKALHRALMTFVSLNDLLIRLRAKDGGKVKPRPTKKLHGNAAQSVAASAQTHAAFLDGLKGKTKFDWDTQLERVQLLATLVRARDACTRAASPQLGVPLDPLVRAVSDSVSWSSLEEHAVDQGRFALASQVYLLMGRACFRRDTPFDLRRISELQLAAYLDAGDVEHALKPLGFLAKRAGAEDSVKLLLSSGRLNVDDPAGTSKAILHEDPDRPLDFATGVNVTMRRFLESKNAALVL